jgi:hypothetical protein
MCKDLPALSGHCFKLLWLHLLVLPQSGPVSVESDPRTLPDNAEICGLDR